MLIAALSLTLAAAGAEDGPSALTARLIEEYPETREAALHIDQQAWPGPLLMQTLAFSGREDLIAANNPRAFTFPQCPDDGVIEGDPIEQIIALIGDARIVMVSEAHDNPLHRHAVMQIGLRLREEGFTVFAAETFNDPPQATDQGLMPQTIGYYSADPVFTRQLQAFHKAGFVFAPYEMRRDQDDPDAETSRERISVREEAQADNFIENILEAHPDARVLVHVGYSHLLKTPVVRDDHEQPWFAARLWEKTGIEPFAISQTHCGAADPSASLHTEGPGTEPEGAVDLFLAHPEVTFTEGRPDWRRETGDVDVPVPDGLTHPGLATVIEARAPDAPLDTLAIERLLLYPGETLPLLLPPGEWRLDAFTVDGRHGEAVTVQVE